MNTRFYSIIIAIACLFSCSNDGDIVDAGEGDETFGTDILSLGLVSDAGFVFEPFLVNDSAIHVCVPNGCDLKKISLSIRHNGYRVLVDGIAYENEVLDFSDFSSPHELSVVSSDSVVRTRTIAIYDLPVLEINTPNGKDITSKTEKTEGCILSLYNAMGECDSLGTAGVEGRGNSTWEEPKKPYNIKLDKKREILGMGKSKHWVLLANAYWDRTQMHNAIAYKMARLTDYPWVQDGRFVELILNGKHKGLYYLCEKIRVEDGRIDIELMNQSDTIDNDINGGYLLETAFAPGENEFQTDYFNKTHSGNPLYWLIKKPEAPSHPSQFSSIRHELNRIEELILNEDSVKTGKYRELLDIENAINWMLVNEAAGNSETDNPSNLFLYRDKGGKLTFGPPWDFDAHTFGAYKFHKSYLLRDDFYFYWLLKDPYFVSRLKEKWESYSAIWYYQIPSFIDSIYYEIRRSALRNENMWTSWHPMYYYPEVGYDTIIQEMKDFFYDHLDYIGAIISSIN